jgi:hypothetical protein
MLWETLREGSGGLGECMETVVRVQSAVSMQQVEAGLGRFLVGEVMDRQWRAAAVLLPGIQLLLEGVCEKESGGCSIHVATNNFRALPFVSGWLQSVLVAREG